MLGRVTYEIFAALLAARRSPTTTGDALDPAGGKEDPRIIRRAQRLPQVRVLDHAAGSRSGSTRASLAAGSRTRSGGCSEQPGKDVNIQGSASIVQALQRADLIDEYHLYVHPVLLGDGKPLFADSARQNLELTALKRYANGACSATHYAAPAVDGA